MSMKRNQLNMTTCSLVKLSKADPQTGSEALSPYSLWHHHSNQYYPKNELCNIEIDIDVRIRNKTRQEKVLEHNFNILKEIKNEKINKINNPHLNPLIN